MNAGVRFQQRRGEYDRAVTALEEALSLLEEAAGNERLRKALRDSVIQRFEFCYELAWKTLKLWLEDKGLSAQTPKDVLREAISVGILQDERGWAAAHENRNLTSHTYDEAKAEDVLEFIRARGVSLFASLRDVLKASESS